MVLLNTKKYSQYIIKPGNIGSLYYRTKNLIYKTQYRTQNSGVKIK